VKNLAELHGGSVRAKSGGIGKGSTFIVSLPISIVRSLTAGEPRLHPTAAIKSDAPPCPNLAGVRITVVDDEPEALDLIKRVLEKCHATVTIYESAEACLKDLAATPADVLISDIGMPGMDGYALMKAVRALAPLEGGATPAVALTAYARSEDRSRAMLSGFDIHVARPVEPSELLAVVARLARRT
jgi:CheY-like chemotaxis protein